MIVTHSMVLLQARAVRLFINGNSQKCRLLSAKATIPTPQSVSSPRLLTEMLREQKHISLHLDKVRFILINI